MSTRDVKSRAASGVVLLMGRGVALQGLSFLGTLVLARLLVPEDFGVVAVGLAVLNIGQTLAGTGLGSALVARREAPTRQELRALTGLQLLVTSVIATVAATVAIAIGEGALVTALMVLALPLMAFRTPALLLFQRRLEFAPEVKVEVAETIVYLVVAVAGAASGLGAWSLAIATVVRALAGTLAAIVMSPLGFLVPSMQFSGLRSILGFGWRVQANGVSQLIWGTALTAGIGSVAGLGALGLWSFALGILRVPHLLFEALWRVGFPTFSRLMESGATREMRDLLERTVGTFSVAASVILCPLVASSPALVPLLFGAKWADVSLILPGSAIALTVAAPIGMVASSYFYARGEARTALLASIITGVLRLIVTLALLPGIGVVAIGIGWAAGALGAMAFMVPRARRASGARLLSRVAGPTTAGTIAAMAGWLVAESLGVTALSAMISGLVASGLWLLLMSVLARGTLKDGLAMGRNLLGSAFGQARSAWRRPSVAVPSSSG